MRTGHRGFPTRHVPAPTQSAATRQWRNEREHPHDAVQRTVRTVRTAQIRNPSTVAPCQMILSSTGVPTNRPNRPHRRCSVSRSAAPQHSVRDRWPGPQTSSAARSPQSRRKRSRTSLRAPVCLTSTGFDHRVPLSPNRTASSASTIRPLRQRPIRRRHRSPSHVRRCAPSPAEMRWPPPRMPDAMLPARPHRLDPGWVRSTHGATVGRHRSLGRRRRASSGNRRIDHSLRIRRGGRPGPSSRGRRFRPAARRRHEREP